MSIPDEQAFVKPIIMVDELRIGAARSSLKKARSSESTVMWAAMALIGMVAMVYALRLARQPAPASAPTPASVVIRQESPIARPIPRSPSLVPKARPRFSDAATPGQPSDAVPKAERVATVGEGAARKAVDPVEGFDTGAAFDNPPSPGRYGQRTSGLLERTTLPNNNARPNTPDPSFRSPR